MAREARPEPPANIPGAWPHLINSKLKPPRPTAICIHREPLVRRVDAATRRHVTLLTAPTGSGKTTLLTQWYERRASSRAIAWLSLDELDDDPIRFFSYLIGAVHAVIPSFDPSVAGRRDGEDERLIASAAAVIGERLNAIDRELIIVIDDFQCIASPLLLRSFDYLLRGSPPTVHWLIAGRCLPDVHLGRLRVSDQLAVLGADDLCFDSASILELGRRLSERSLSMEEAQLIRERTEGWVAGAKLALLANAEPQGAADALQRFAGSHAEVARYLGESVLSDQPPPIRQFLLASSIVDRMTGELCDALLGVADSQSTLERLESAQLFIQALDGHHCWYRYHALFRDFLRACLRRDGAAQLPLLHERASRWYAEHQMSSEALEHAFECRNASWRNELLVRCIGLWLQTGEIAQVLHWSERLPRAELIAEHAICRSYIAALILGRRFEDAASVLKDFREAVSQDPAGVMHARLLAAMFAVLTDRDGDVALDDAAALRCSGVDAFLIGTLLILQAYVALRRNRFDEARRIALRARDAVHTLGVYERGYAEVVAALADRAQGDFMSAASRFEQMFAEVRGGPRNPAWVNAATALAYLRYEENRLDEAESLSAEVLPLLSVASTIENFTAAYMALSRTRLIGGRTSEALQLLDYLHSVLEGGAHWRFLAQVWAEKIRLAILAGDSARAWSMAVEFGLERRAQEGEWSALRDYDEAWERAGGAYALALSHANRCAEARAILERLRDSAHAVGYVYREIRLEAALACCRRRAGDHQDAFDALNRALGLTRGVGFTRGVFDETPGLTQLLHAAFEQRKLRCVLPRQYLQKFENVFARNAVPRSALGSTRRAALPLEPLTDREIAMLRLLAEGLSNAEISQRSQVALSTAKWHLKNVFAKLDVSTRTGALARARELRLIE